MAGQRRALSTARTRTRRSPVECLIATGRRSSTPFYDALSSTKFYPDHVPDPNISICFPRRLPKVRRSPVYTMILFVLTKKKNQSK